MNRSSLEFAAGQFAAAEELAEQALALRDRDENPMQWADAAFNLASIRLAVGHEAEAVDTLRAYIATFEEEVGHVHPDVALGYQTLSVALLGSGDMVAGETALRTALDIFDRTIGDEHPAYANPLSDLAELEANRENYHQAITLARRALELRLEHGAEPLRAAGNRLSIAHWLAELGRLDEADRELEQAQVEAVAAVGEAHPALAEYHVVQAGLAALRGRRAESLASMERAEALLVAAHGEDHPRVWLHRVAWAQELVVLGDDAGAIQTLRTLLARMDGKDAGVAEPLARFELAKALLERSPRAPEIPALTEAARRGYRALGRATSAEEVALWQTAQGASMTYAAPSSTADDPL